MLRITRIKYRRRGGGSLFTHYINYRGRTIELCSAWQGQPGRVICRGKGKGPHNVLLETKIGRVVVPGRNVRVMR